MKKNTQNITASELLMTGFEDELQRQLGFTIRCAIPAIIKNIDFEKQTCTAQPAIREYLILKNKYEWVELPELADVPFFILGGGDWFVSFPIKEGDECLLIFADLCIDAWWANGGVQNQMDSRRHDLSDAFALIGFRSQPKKYKNLSKDKVEIRNQNKETALSFSSEGVEIQAAQKIKVILNKSKIEITAGTSAIEIQENGKITIKSSGSIDITGQEVLIQNKNFLSHTHSTPQGATGGVI